MANLFGKVLVSQPPRPSGISSVWGGVSCSAPGQNGQLLLLTPADVGLVGTPGLRKSVGRPLRPGAKTTFSPVIGLTLITVTSPHRLQIKVSLIGED